jgi:outer membrane receptor protein involved in Fe transport
MLAAVIAAVICSMAAQAAGQTSLATLRGKVADEQGGVLPGATVTIKQTETNFTRTGVTNENGQYYVPSLPSGSYQVTVELSGFGAEKQAMSLRVGQEATADFTLRVGTLQETVEVSGRATIVETQATLSSAVDKQQLDDLPTIGRNFADLAKLAPGVTSSGGSAMGFSTAGQRQFQNQVFVDGATNAQQFYGTQAESYPQDWVQEFQVMTNGFSAEFGQASGGVLNVITRSGSNTFSGRLYGFYRNDNMDTPPFAGQFGKDSSGKYDINQPIFLAAVPAFNQYRAGGFLGGPVLKNKAFFFGGYETYSNDQDAVLAISQYWRDQGQLGVIPASNTSKVYIVKGDVNASDKNRLSFRHSQTIRTDTNCSGQGGDGCNSNPRWTMEKRATFDGPLWSVLGNWTSTLTNNSFNELRAYYGVNKLAITSNIAGVYGMDLLNGLASHPLWTESTYPGASFGSATTGGVEGESNFYVIDNFMFVKGKHQLKVGGQLARVEFVMDIDASQKGRWTFDRDVAFDIKNPASYPYQLSLAIGTATYSEPRWNPSAFFQDTWQVSNALTLNLGLRYDVDNTILVGNELVPTYNQRFVENFGGTAPLSTVEADTNNVSPRFGFVWVPWDNRRTTVRGSTGIFYDQNHFNYNDTYINQTLLTVNRITINSNDSTQNPFWDPANPTASRAAARAYLASFYPGFPPASNKTKQTATGMDSNFHVPYSLQATGGMTHEFANRIYVQADGVYSHGYDVVLQRNVNITQDAAGTWVGIDPRFGAFNVYQNLGYISYAALQSRVEYRGTKLRGGISYTYSKARSNSSATGVGGGLATNPLDISVDDGPTSEDRRHVLASDFSYIFPLEFQLAGIARYGSPLPYSATNSNVVYARPLPRNSLRGDSEWNLDLRVSKNFRFAGHMGIVAFWEMFNVFNATNFIQYQGNQLSSTYQLPQGAQPMRRQQIGLRFDF